MYVCIFIIVFLLTTRNKRKIFIGRSLWKSAKSFARRPSPSASVVPSPSGEGAGKDWRALRESTRDATREWRRKGRAGPVGAAGRPRQECYVGMYQFLWALRLTGRCLAGWTVSPHLLTFLPSLLADCAMVFLHLIITMTRLPCP